MKNLFLFYAVITFLFAVSSTTIALGEKSNYSVNLEFVKKWPEISPEDSNLPQITKVQLINEIEKALKAQQEFKSWEARYKVTSHQFERQIRDRDVPEGISSSNIRIVSNGNKSYYEEENGYPIDDQSHNTRFYFVSNGQKLFKLWPDRKDGQIGSANRLISSVYPKISDFLPALSLELKFREIGFPEIIDILTDSDTQLLPWCTSVNGQICYVLEKNITLSQPIFRNMEESEKWKKANQKEAEKLSKEGIYSIIDPTAKPEDIYEKETTYRLAIAPNLGFAVVRWAYGYEMNKGRIHISFFPENEINYNDFRQMRQDLYIPHKMTYTQYVINEKQEKQIHNETELLLDVFVSNKQYNASLFEINFPEGYKVIDLDKDIVYTVGDSEETIDSLIEAANIRDGFYNNLKLEEAPALEYSKWINSESISLSDYKGKLIILHFWGCNCAPCLSELPMLQEQYGQQSNHPSSEMFISIHQYVEGDNYDQLNETINEYGITFPVMIDAHDPENLSWGKTFKKYQIFGIPTEVKIDKEGHFDQVDKAPISTKDSQRLKEPKD